MHNAFEQKNNRSFEHSKERFRENLWNILFFLLILILAVVILSLILSVHAEVDEETRVGAIFIGSVDDGGWNENQYNGLVDVCNNMNIPYEISENVDETYPDCLREVRRLNARGCQVIFLTSAGFGENVYKVAEAFPKIMFYTVSPDSEPVNMASCFGRLYQMRYLCGMIAARQSETGVLGFVVSQRDPQIYRSVNAYYLGAKAVNPNIKLKIAFTDSWTDEKLEREYATRMIEEEHADVLTYHTSTPVTIDVAEEAGIYSIGYNYVEKHYSNHFLTAAVVHWDVLYEEILRDYLRGTVKDDYWLGYESDAVGLLECSPSVSRSTLKKVRTVSESFDDGWDVFLGEIRSVDLTVRCRKDERIGDENLLFNMNWLVSGVEEIAD